MKTIAELKEMHFIPHHDCACCGEMVGWYANEPNPYFDSSCGCGSGGGHYDTWEDVFKWYNTVFEKETEEAVQAAWNKEAMAYEKEKLTTQYVRSELQEFRQEVSSQLNMLLYRIGTFAEECRVDSISNRLENIERTFFSFSNCKPVLEMLQNHKSSWIPNSRGGEPNCRRG